MTTDATVVRRCQWAAATPEFFTYHDAEWGFPITQDQRLFETICLEGFQSGLSWRTILAKRENFRSAFASFDFRVVAQFDDGEVEKLLSDRGIVRHRAKIEAVIHNAGRVVDLVENGEGLTKYFWRFDVDTNALSESPTASVPSMAVHLSNDLRKIGWKFVGPTTVFSFMQASGLINGHDSDCSIHPLVTAERERAREFLAHGGNSSLEQ